MSGHNKWSQIQHKKSVTDAKRGALFSKLLAAISVAAKQELNPSANPRLRSAIEKAKENKVPQENIERAISKAAEQKNLEEVLIEAYGPEGVGLIIEAITDNKNRTTSEIRHLLDENGAKMATPGSVLWSFEKQGMEWKAKFQQPISEEGKIKLQKLIEILENHDDVQRVISNF
ncbi:MAG: YebC/PmpR family DNA-binding transcriptional regulator [Patescibacteria group bacterium]